jgi:hypothetical protein
MLRNSSLVRRLTLILVLFLLAGFFIIAFHHHDDGGNHDDCPVCAVAHNVSSAVFSSFIVAIFLAAVVSSLFEKAVPFALQFVSILSSRAPPA